MVSPTVTRKNVNQQYFIGLVKRFMMFSFVYYRSMLRFKTVFSLNIHKTLYIKIDEN